MTEPIDVATRVAANRWFWLLLFRPGPRRDQDAATAEQIQEAHLAHLFRLESEGRLTLFGPVLDATDLRGIGVLIAPTRADAEALVADDPAVLAGRLVLEVRSWFARPGAALPSEGAETPEG